MSTGIIGGADGPTSIIVTQSGPSFFGIVAIAILCAIVIGGVIFWVVKKR